MLGRLVTSASNLEGWSPEEIEDMVKNVAVVAFEGGLSVLLHIISMRQRPHNSCM